MGKTCFRTHFEQPPFLSMQAYSKADESLIRRLFEINSRFNIFTMGLPGTPQETIIEHFQKKFKDVTFNPK
jgi:hypothetical protein